MGFPASGCTYDCTLLFWAHFWSSYLASGLANKSHLNTVWWPSEVRWWTICAMTLLIMRDFYSQTYTQPCCFHPLGVHTNPPSPVPPFLLTLNQSPKEIAGNDITNCLTYTMYAIAFKAARRVMQTLEVWADTKLCQDISHSFKDYLVSDSIVCKCSLSANMDP